MAGKGFIGKDNECSDHVTSGIFRAISSSSDIGANLTDPMYSGLYHGSQKHPADLDAVLERAWSHGMKKMMVTGGSLDDSTKALELAKKHGRQGS